MISSAVSRLRAMPAPLVRPGSSHRIWTSSEGAGQSLREPLRRAAFGVALLVGVGVALLLVVGVAAPAGHADHHRGGVAPQTEQSDAPDAPQMLNVCRDLLAVARRDSAQAVAALSGCAEAPRRRLHTQAKLALPEGGHPYCQRGSSRRRCWSASRSGSGSSGRRGACRALVAALRVDSQRAAGDAGRAARGLGDVRRAHAGEGGVGASPPDSRCDGVRSRAWGSPSGRWRSGERRGSAVLPRARPTGTLGGMKKRLLGWIAKGRGFVAGARGWVAAHLLGLTLGVSAAGVVAGIVVTAVDPGWVSGGESGSTTIRNLSIVLAGLVALPLAVWRGSGGEPASEGCTGAGGSCAAAGRHSTAESAEQALPGDRRASSKAAERPTSLSALALTRWRDSG